MAEEFNKVGYKPTLGANAPDLDPKFKVCPECGEKILAEGTRGICDECNVPYITEKALAEKKVAEEATRKKVVKAKSDYQEALDTAKAKLNEALSD